MSLKTYLKYQSNSDQLVGLEDYGYLGKTKNEANHALVIMLRGIQVKWKQPVGYFLARAATKDPVLKTLLEDEIWRANVIECMVKAVVCDQGSTNRSMYNLLGVSPARPFFEREGQQIFCLFDAENIFLKYDFEVAGNIISTKHVRDFYNHETAVQIRQCPKLSLTHLKLTNFSNMKVRLTTQLFSHSVAAGILAYGIFEYYRTIHSILRNSSKEQISFLTFSTGRKIC